jgi:hypothetical protein
VRAVDARLTSEMNPAGCAAPSSISSEPWPARSDAKVAFLAGEHSAAERIARRLFQRPLEPWEYAGLAGAPCDAQVEVGASCGKLYLELSGPAAATYRAYFYVRRTAEDIVVINDGVNIPLRRLRGCGAGLRIFRRQVTTALALGIRRIEVVAGRRADENGYYTWPRFGFEGKLPARLRRALPADLERARTVLDLMECDRGLAWWYEHGATIRATFDLAAGSRSRAAWDRYLRNKLNSEGGPKRNLEISPAISYGIAQ